VLFGRRGADDERKAGLGRDISVASPPSLAGYTHACACGTSLSSNGLSPLLRLPLYLARAECGSCSRRGGKGGLLSSNQSKGLGVR